MTDDETEAPAVPLGDGPDVAGVPLAQVTGRLHFGIEASEVVRREGETRIRTPTGPRDLAAVIEESDETYFPTRQAFETAVRDVIGTGPVPTE
ncbi:DUF5789 family protein [Halosegnis sp.]|uniref:DUF5789 family protein n=1 Tax=Halosegnis sp. TaxID=2864959 RepID=UPI0035D4703E